jgi:hypothetical protein
VRRLPINWPVFGCAYPITTMPTFVRMLSQYGLPNIHCLRYINTLSYGGVWLLLVCRKFDELIKGMIYQVNFCKVEIVGNMSTNFLMRSHAYADAHACNLLMNYSCNYVIDS